MTESSRSTQAAQDISLTPIERDLDEAWVNNLLQRQIEHSPWTAEHAERVSQIAISLGKMDDLNEHSLYLLRVAGKLHDIGKIFVPVEILNNTNAKLTPEQKTIIMKHPRDGFDLVKPFNLEIAQIITAHHEILHEKPYPRVQQREANDPLRELKLLVSIADCVDAGISKRPYKPTLPPNDVLEKLVGFGINTTLASEAIMFRLGLDAVKQT